jgi:hypothetical protein
VLLCREDVLGGVLYEMSSLSVRNQGRGRMPSLGGQFVFFVACYPTAVLFNLQYSGEQNKTPKSQGTQLTPHDNEEEKSRGRPLSTHDINGIEDEFNPSLSVSWEENNTD